nr:tRNA (adenosine(37)-N6)-threonylcarbamoyltransferase complex ATPase subunit type 1 TsaE [Dongia mobilis]
MTPVPGSSIAVITLADEAATRRAAALLAQLVRTGDVIALHGDLGAGKTTFARGFIAALAPAEEAVPSPTFTLVQTYPSARGEIWHFDLYRLKRADEAWELGIEEAFAAGISLIEWPERLGSLLPSNRLDVTLAPGVGPESRRLLLAGAGDWRERLAGIEQAWATAARQA